MSIRDHLLSTESDEQGFGNSERPQQLPRDHPEYRWDHDADIIKAAEGLLAFMKGSPTDYIAAKATVLVMLNAMRPADILAARLRLADLCHLMQANFVRGEWSVKPVPEKKIIVGDKPS